MHEEEVRERRERWYLNEKKKHLDKYKDKLLFGIQRTARANTDGSADYVKIE
jgi:hypothetical protein